ncbi:hypothetical protein GE061_013313 [Apolygus lucorum]|uniref:Calcitonin receptor n=1 Tax=Apolygus lucorum TaxID=248454 RepID=A0A8S9XMG6_APOLU|nr:hypothetical protein GE061_013313 [Apolygus lucorum]
MVSRRSSKDNFNSVNNFTRTLENKTSENSLSSNIKFLLGLKKACDARKREQFKQLQNLISIYPDENGYRPFCPATFDGWSCWNTTPSGETAFAPCPYFVTGFDETRFAFRTCLANGSWFPHPDTGQPWSNYTTCIDLEDLKFRNIVNTIFVVGYYISFAALVASLVIFLSFRSLRCTRIAIHVHLFSSFASNNLMWIIWYKLVVGNTTVVQENQVFCQVMHVILQYLMVANYMWMFCEGLHLHLALVVVFVKDDSALRWFYFIGWFLPAIITIIYAAVRSSNPEETRDPGLDGVGLPACKITWGSRMGVGSGSGGVWLICSSSQSESAKIPVRLRVRGRGLGDGRGMPPSETSGE